ncbi:MAG: hypothetical protein MJZ68_07435 [archaeon]|nr:hypothetical protein [archaeon]
MSRHYIVLSSSYSTGRRIALHLVDPEPGEYKGCIDTIRSAYGGKRVPFGVHSITTGSSEWGSVVDKDPYFNDVSVIGSLDEFVSLIRRDRYLKGSDVAEYILSKERCTYTRLETLTYLCYADYLCGKGQRLFEDRIYATSEGPTVDTVYAVYSDRCSPGSVTEDKELETPEYMPAKSRIMFSEDGPEKVRSIDGSLDRYRVLTTEALVGLVHGDDTPWAVTDGGKTGQYAVIEDRDIVGYHCNEEPSC